MTKRNDPCPCGSNIKYKRCCGISEINNDKPKSAEEHYSLGCAYAKQNMLEKATACFQKALQLNTDYFQAYMSLGDILFIQVRQDEAIDCYRKALSINPSSSIGHYNLARAYFDKKLLDEALQSFQTAAKNAPGNSRFYAFLIEILNQYVPNSETECPYVKVQKSLQQINTEYVNTRMISDETVRQLYQQCRSTIALHQLDINTDKNQLFRGTNNNPYCHRHLMVFNKYNIIPEYCFECYKVTLEPRTVMELFKLLLVFDKLKLPNDNLRKCIVEVRPEMSGTYKGFIYCRSLDEGKDVLKIVEPIVSETIYKGIPIFVKRGCSEFSIAYPAYGQITENKIQQMTYDEEWRKHEAYVDENLVTHEDVVLDDFSRDHSLNHSGFTLLDALVMTNWLAYAETIGDKTYLDIEPTFIKSCSNS